MNKQNCVNLNGSDVHIYFFSEHIWLQPLSMNMAFVIQYAANCPIVDGIFIYTNIFGTLDWNIPILPKK